MNAHAAGIISGMEKAAVLSNRIRSALTPEQIRGLGVENADMFAVLMAYAEEETKQMRGGGALVGGQSTVRVLMDVKKAIQSGNYSGATNMLKWWHKKSPAARYVSPSISQNISRQSRNLPLRRERRTVAPGVFHSDLPMSVQPEHLKKNITSLQSPLKVERGHGFAQEAIEFGRFRAEKAREAAARIKSEARAAASDTVTTSGPDTSGAAARAIGMARRYPKSTAALAIAGAAGIAYAAKKGLERRYGRQFYNRYDDDQKKTAFYEGGRVWPGGMSVKDKKKKSKPSSVQMPLKPDNQVSGEEQHERK
jgi:hypothetical protein